MQSVAAPAPAADSNGTFEVGKVVVEGSEVADADVVAESLEKDLHRCPASGTPATSQQLRVKAKVGPHGEVRFAKTEGTDGSQDNQFAACLATQVAEASFAPPNGKDATIIIPIAVVYR